MGRLGGWQTNVDFDTKAQRAEHGITRASIRMLRYTPFCTMTLSPLGTRGSLADCHDLVREYYYHMLNCRDRDRFHHRASNYFTQEQDWLAAAYHHFERRAFDAALGLLAQHTNDIINSGGCLFGKWRCAECIELCGKRAQVKRGSGPQHGARHQLPNA